MHMTVVVVYSIICFDTHYENECLLVKFSEDCFYLMSEASPRP